MLTRWLERHVNTSYTLLRVVAGLLFSFHGMQKLFGVFSPFRPPVGSQVWCGAIIELVSGLAIASGAYTSCAAFVASGTMAVAYVQFHWRFHLGAQLLPAINKGELALLYSFLFLFIACRGAGPWSVRSWIARKRDGTIER